MSTKQELAKRLSFNDMVVRGGGTPDAAKPVVFNVGSHQFQAPGIYADKPQDSKKPYCDEIDAMSEMVEHTENFPSHGFNDVAVGMTRVLRSMDAGIARSKRMGPFTPPQERTVETGYTPEGVMQYETIPGGAMTIPGMDNWGAWIEARKTSSGEPYIAASFPRFAQDAMNGLFGFIRDHLLHHSIYRGQIIDVDYNYINVVDFDPKQVVYNNDISAAVHMACVSPIIDMEPLLAAGEKPNRKVLLAGDPGTGKTILFKVSQKVLFGRGTGIVCPAGSNAEIMQKAVRMARNYMTKDQMAAVYIEDIEKMPAENRALALENLDGQMSKSDRLLVMMTTNFPDGIDAAFLRQGRVDDFIRVGLPDLDAFTRLIKYHLGGVNGLPNKLDEDSLTEMYDQPDGSKKSGWELAFESYHDYTPAWIVGGMSKVVRAYIARTHTADDIKVTAQDLIDAANLMRDQWELQQASANAAPKEENIEDRIRRIVEESQDPDLADDRREKLVAAARDGADEAIEHRIHRATVKLETESGKEITGNIATN